MTTRVFILGATGYVGGDALHELAKSHPEYEYTCMVRNSDKGAKIAAVYPQIKLVYGDLDSASLIEEEASKADIVYNFADADHEVSATSTVKGLARRNATTPGYLIHTSGTLVLSWEDMARGPDGNGSDRVYNDWEGVNELTSQPDHADHRNVDKIILAASREYPDKVKTAIVCPPMIYGQGRGPDNQRSFQVYFAAEAFMNHDKAFKIGRGDNVWHYVHVQDLAKLYLLLTEAAIAGGPPATWNDQGYYLAENGSFAWGEALEAVAKEANSKGWLSSAAVEGVTAKQAEEYFPDSTYAIGTNSRGVGSRARKLLNWQPKEKSLMEEIPIIVESEARRLGKSKGHAATVEL